MNDSRKYWTVKITGDCFLEEDMVQPNTEERAREISATFEGSTVIRRKRRPEEQKRHMTVKLALEAQEQARHEELRLQAKELKIKEAEERYLALVKAREDERKEEDPEYNHWTSFNSRSLHNIRMVTAVSAALCAGTGVSRALDDHTGRASFKPKRKVR